MECLETCSAMFVKLLNESAPSFVEFFIVIPSRTVPTSASANCFSHSCIAWATFFIAPTTTPIIAVIASNLGPTFPSPLNICPSPLFAFIPKVFVIPSSPLNPVLQAVTALGSYFPPILYDIEAIFLFLYFLNIYFVIFIYELNYSYHYLFFFGIRIEDIKKCPSFWMGNQKFHKPKANSASSHNGNQHKP